MTHFSLMEIFSIQLTSHLLMFQTMAIFLKQSKTNSALLTIFRYYLCNVQPNIVYAFCSINTP